MNFPLSLNGDQTETFSDLSPQPQSTPQSLFAANERVRFSIARPAKPAAAKTTRTTIKYCMSIVVSLKS